MQTQHNKNFTLMPLVALGVLSLAATLPVISAATIHAAPPQHYRTVVIAPGDNIWSLAAERAGKGADIQAVVDEIVAVNHIGSSGLTPGQRIRIPQ